MRLLRAADRPAVPWKNGGGLTYEIATFPVGAGIDDFEWRVSIAEVASSGPFSHFDGCDRILTVLDGQLELRFIADGGNTVLCPGQSLWFPGDVAVMGNPIVGPVRDLNVMVRRGRWLATVTPWRPSLGTTIEMQLFFASSPDKWLGSRDAELLDASKIPPTDFTGYLISLTRDASPHRDFQKNEILLVQSN